MVLLVAAFVLPVIRADQAPQPLQQKVRHELVMLPYLSVFDDLAYQVEGDKVVLMGAVTRPILKSDAENAVKRVAGVEQVDNRIEVLPLSPMDDNLRLRLYRSIYSFGPLQKYSLGVQKSILIIVKNGHVTLDGVVDNAADRDMANIRANGVFGVFSVTDNLRVGSAN
jgi:hyperosmotically inducible protein